MSQAIIPFPFPVIGFVLIGAQIKLSECNIRVHRLRKMPKRRKESGKRGKYKKLKEQVEGIYAKLQEIQLHFSGK